MAYITIVKGDDTDFLDNQYLVVKFNTDIELAGFQAIFKLGSIELIYPDLSAKYIEIVLSKEVTSSLQKGKMYGTLKLIDTESRTRTVTTVLPFNVVTKVMNTSQISQQSIQLEVKVEQNEISVDMNILGLSKTVAESYLAQMKQNNAQMTEKVQEMKLIENEVELIREDVAKSQTLAEQWAIAEGLVNDSDYSAKYYAERAKEELQLLTEETNAVIKEAGNLLAEAKESVAEAKTVLSETLDVSNITNCLLEVPQRIKYDLVDGTLTIKAGSVVIVPYGIEDLTAQYPVGATFLNDNFKVVDTQYEDGKFFVWAELKQDKSFSRATTDTAQRFLVFYLDKDTLEGTITTATISGDVSPATGLFYNTVDNTIKYYSNSTILNNITCFPFGLCTANGTNIFGSIDQVFNGMGYIGSTVWLDKGVKCLIPNGRNADGSLNNLEVTNDSLLTTTFTSTENMALVYQPYSDESKYKLWNRSAAKFYYQAENPDSVAIYSQWYNTAENQWYTSENTNYCTFKKNFAVIGYQDCTDGVISNFKPRTAFQAVDYNDFCRLNAEALRDSDKVTITRWAMPSGTTKTLTLGTSGTKYTAPADGYFSICGELTSSNGYVDMSCNSVKIKCNGQTSGTDCNVFVPAKKGASCMVQYLNFGLAQSYQSFVFVYAEGAK